MAQEIPKYLIPALEEYCFWTAPQNDRYHYLQDPGIVSQFKKKLEGLLDKSCADITLAQFSKAYKKRFLNPDEVRIAVDGNLGYLFRVNGCVRPLSVFCVEDFNTRYLRVQHMEKRTENLRGQIAVMNRGKERKAREDADQKQMDAFEEMLRAKLKERQANQ